MGDGERDPVRVCWVASSSAERVAAELSAQRDAGTIVEAEPSAVTRLLAGGAVDGVVSRYRLDETTGIDLLRSVRAEFPDVPFLLYPQRGDEQIASSAVTADVTEYLPGGTDGVAPETAFERAIEAVREHRRDRQYEESEQRYQQMLDTVGDIVYTLDTGGYVTTVNDATVEMTGYEREELLGEHVSTVLEPPEVAAGERLIQRLLETDEEQGTVEMTVVTADNEQIPCENHIAVLSDPDGSFAGTVGVMRDISERKRREEVLQSLHDATRELMAAGTPTEVAGIASKTASEVLGLPLNGVFLYQEDIDALVSVGVSPVAADRFELPIEFERDEGIAWDVYETGEPRAFDDVREAQGVYNPATPVRSELVLPLGDHGVMIAGSTDTGAISDSDRALANVLAANTQAALAAAKREQSLREREQALRERETTLERQNERLDEFASVVSHDLRNPLNVAQGRLELYTETGDEKHAQKVVDAHVRMEEIIGDVLTLAREGQAVSTVESVDIETVARNAWSNVATKGAHLAIEDPPLVEADESRLQQLLENLFRNAIEHGIDEPHRADGVIGDGGTPVRVRVGTVPKTGVETTGFYVADDGPGIPPENRDQVFESGYSTDDTGTGFGLSIVDQIVSAHGWAISVAESEWGGARFEITGVRSPR